MARTPDIRRVRASFGGPSDLNPTINLQVTDPRGTNVWPTVTRVRLNMAVIGRPGSEDEADAMLGVGIWFGIVAQSSGNPTTPPPPGIDPWLNPNDNQWMDIGMLEPVNTTAASGTSTFTWPTIWKPPEGVIDTRAQRRFDTPDEFVAVWLVLTAKDRFGVDPVMLTTTIQFLSSVVFLRAD